ncbi:hypothetical protein D9M68_745990 [compost metagenome]
MLRSTDCTARTSSMRAAIPAAAPQKWYLLRLMEWNSLLQVQRKALSTQLQRPVSKSPMSGISNLRQNGRCYCSLLLDFSGSSPAAGNRRKLTVNGIMANSWLCLVCYRDRSGGPGIVW